MKELNTLQASVKHVRDLETELQDAVDMIELATEEGDEALVCGKIHLILKKVHEESQKAQIISLLSGEVDRNGAYLEVNSGAGGTEAL